MMNPDENRLESVDVDVDKAGKTRKPDGELTPEHWGPLFEVGDLFVLRRYVFRIARLDAAANELVLAPEGPLGTCADCGLRDAEGLLDGKALCRRCAIRRRAGTLETKRSRARKHEKKKRALRRKQARRDRSKGRG